MSVLDPRIDGWIDAIVERSGTQLRAELAGLIANMGEAVERQQTEASREARTAAEAAANALLTEAIAAERLRAAQQAEARASEAQAALTAAQATIDRMTTEIAALQDHAETLAGETARRHMGVVADVRGEERHADHATASALNEACRALDAAATLSSVLSTFIDHASRRVSRCALFVVKNGTLRGWEWRGFVDAGTAATQEVLHDDRTPVARAWASGAVESSAPDEVAGHVLAPCNEGRTGAAIPVLVDGRVVAVLYAEDEHGGSEAPDAWPGQLDLLARYAGRCLESLTIRRMPDLVRASAAEPTRAQAARYDEESAQRYARLLVAEIRLYHEASLEEGRRHGDILRRLRPQIERAQALYNERVPAAARARTTYFEDELVRTLAGGDQALLGQPT